MNNDARLFAASVIQSQLNGKVKYELSDSDVLELYYTEPRLAALIEMDIIKLIDHHLVVNLKEFITPKTKHLSAHAKRNKSACCIGIQYASKGQYYKSGENASNCTLDIILRAAGFLETMFMMMLSSTAGTISREYDGERTDIAHDTPILAANVINRNGGASWKINLTKPSDDAGERSYDLAEFGGIIGTMDTNASAAVDIAMDTLDTDTAPAVIVGSGSLGFACGTMKSGSQLSFTLSSDRGIADITTTEGNVGGLVGTIENGAVFDYTGVNVQGTSALIKTETGYAGGIVGSNSGTVILGTSPYTVGQYIEGTSGAGGVYGYFIYQTFVQTYDMLEDIGKDSEIGIVPEAGLHIGDRDKAYYIMAGKVNAADFIESNSNKITSPEYLYDPDKDSQIELRNNVNLIRYLSDSDNQNAVTLRVKYDLAYSASDLSYQFPKKDEGINDNIGTKVIGYSNISSSLESAAYSATSVHKEDNYDTNGDPAGIRYYTDEDTKATLDYMVVETKDEMAGPYSYLGKNASELGNALSFVDTNALYDTRNLKGPYEYIELDMELFGKWDNYTAPIAVTDYLKNIRIDGIGTNTLYDQNKTDAEQTGDTVKVDTTDPNKLRLWVRKDQLLTQAEGMYLFPISYDVLTGDASFNSDGFMYSNYKVQLTAVTCGSLGSTTYTKSSYATDHLIYTNARLEPTVIN